MEEYKACLMVTLDIPQWSDLINGFIQKEDIYDNEENEYGLETNPHCTALFGLHNESDLEEIKKVLFPNHEITVSFENISIFENDEYDVVKFDIDSLPLRLINATLREKFDYQNDYPDYHPHVTIGYLKPGTGKKYIKKIESFELVVNDYYYSTYDGEGNKVKKNFEIFK